MNIYSIISKLTDNGEVHIYLDIDGVLANYNVGNLVDFKEKRILHNNVDSVKFLSTIPNVELYILSVCKDDMEKLSKNSFLDMNANFIMNDHRIFLNKADKAIMEIKSDYLKGLNRSNKIVYLDSDNSVLEYVKYNNNDIEVLHASELVD